MELKQNSQLHAENFTRKHPTAEKADEREFSSKFCVENQAPEPLPPNQQTELRADSISLNSGDN
jgi:hypothetical protein